MARTTAISDRPIPRITSRPSDRPVCSAGIGVCAITPGCTVPGRLDGTGGAGEVLTSGAGLAATSPRGNPAIGFLEQRGDRLRILLLLGELDERRGAPDQVALDHITMKPQVSQGRPGMNGDLAVFQVHQDDDRPLGIQRQPPRLRLVVPCLIQRIHVLDLVRRTGSRRAHDRHVIRLPGGFLQPRDLSGEGGIPIGHARDVDPTAIERRERRLVLPAMENRPASPRERSMRPGRSAEIEPGSSALPTSWNHTAGAPSQRS